MKIEIIDDFMSSYYHNIYLNMFDGAEGDDKFPWLFNDSLNGKGYKGNYYFNNVIVQMNDGYINEGLMPLFDPLLIRLKINIGDVHRIKANLYPWKGRRRHHQTHTDYPSGHNLRTCLYYVNDSNRVTIFDGKKKIKCKGNRAIIFDGSTPHHSTSPTDTNYGISINIDYKEKDL